MKSVVVGDSTAKVDMARTIRPIDDMDDSCALNQGYAKFWDLDVPPALLASGLLHEILKRTAWRFSNARS
jgi:hypothetical protein